MGKAKSVNWRLKLKGFGPFANQLDCSMSSSSAKAAIYAGNGQGKSTISRLFRLAENPQMTCPRDLITRGAAKGTFSFTVGDSSSSLGSLEIDSSTGVDNQLGYLFHVFNSDYVRDNLQSRSYRPSGDIEGYIVGKSNIDLSNERQKLDDILQRGVNAKNVLAKTIEESKSELISLGAGRVKEFQGLDVDLLMNRPVEEDCYFDKIGQLRAVSELPDDAQAPDRLRFDYSYLDLDQLASLLERPYSKANFAEAFLEKVRRDAEFIKAGMRIQDGNCCPFCGRRYDEEARSLIGQYDSYLKDQEAAVIAKLRDKRALLSQLISDYGHLETQVLRGSSSYGEMKRGFDDLAGENFPTFVTTDDFAAIVKAVMSEVDKKIDDITRPISADAVKQLRDVLEACQPKLRETNDLIGRLASDLGKSKARKTALRKDVCIELGKRVRREQREAFEEIAALRAEYKSLEAEIRVKEAQNKRSKKEAVAQLMAELLTNVFGDRYVFDEADFTIRFKGEALGESADSVLSDGEKAALAFCFYIASTWELINEEDDKNKLFFVIDDPVSSMDFNYVYSIMQIIKGLQGAFGLNRARILLLTHNVAFFNMLMGEHLFSGAWMLDGGQVVKVKNELLAPYASHLRAISNVADGAMPDHTTGNSIRQVLETLMHFEDPSIKELGVYLNSDFGKDLREVACLQLICNDQSHGARTYGYVQPPMDVSLIRRGCSAVLRHIRERYPGQLVTAGIDVSESRPAS